MPSCTRSGHGRPGLTRSWRKKGRGLRGSGFEYLLEVDGVLSVLEVWSAWREGLRRTPEEAAEAVIHYGKRDAYLPVG